MSDFCKRTQLQQRLIEHLILVGAFAFTKKKPRTLIWELGKIDHRPNTLDLVYAEEEDDPILPRVSLREVMGLEYEIMGVSLRDHVITLYTKYMKKKRILGSRDFRHAPAGKTVQVAGQWLVQQGPPTTKGFKFITLEDQDGFVNVIDRPQVWANYRRTFRSSPLLIVIGEVQRQHGVINLIAEEAVLLTLA